MFSYHGIVIIVMVLAADDMCSAYFNFDFWPVQRGPTLPTCNPGQTCDQAVKVYATTSPASSIIYQTELPSCSCTGNRCATGWDSSDRTRSITRDLVTNGQRVKMMLHYCDPIPEVRACNQTEVSLVVDGGWYPTNIREVRCNCEQSEPLQVRKSYYDERNTLLVVKELVCTLPVCDVNATSRQKCRQWKGSTRATEYLCQCPVGQSCLYQSNPGNEGNYFCERNNRV